MSKNTSDVQKADLSYVAAIVALTIGMVGIALLLYYLLDILLVFFLGVVVAAALQPAHVRLSSLGIPKGPAVLLIYLLFVIIIGLIVFFVGPVLVEQVNSFAGGFPEQYTRFTHMLRVHPTPLLRRVGSSIPPFDVLTANLADLFPKFFDDLLTFMTSTVSFFISFVVVLVIGFYWTMEVPHLERFVLSLVPVARRPQVLNVWHEIEFRLGAFIRGQGLAMLIIGVASAVGYYLIGLPNVLMLAVLAGLFEAIPIIGPVLAAIPAVLVASPLGSTKVLLVISYVALLQVFENNILLPRIMNYVVGISTLVTLFAILALGTLYGVLGVFIAIPLTVVIQVLLDRMMINPEPTPQAATLAENPIEILHARIQALRQQIRVRLRERESRMGIDPQSVEHVADAVDQRIERAVERIATAIATVPKEKHGTGSTSRKMLITGLHRALQELEQAIEQMDTVIPVTQDDEEASGAEPKETDVEDLSHVTQQVELAVQHVESVVAQVQKNLEAQRTKDEVGSDTGPEAAVRASLPSSGNKLS